MPDINSSLLPVVLPHEASPLARARANLTRGYRPASEFRGPPIVASATSYYQTPGSPMVPEWDATEAIKWAYYANVYVYACVRAIAEDIASLGFKAGLDPDDPEDDDPTCALASLLGPPPGGPALSISPQTWWEWTIAQLLVTGRFSHEITRDSTGTPDGLWPIPSQLLTPITSTKPGQWFDAYRYQSGTTTRTLRPQDVFYYWRPSLHDIRQPESVLQAARLDVSVAVMQDRYDFAFLKNDARPASVIVHEQFSVPNERDVFRRQFLAEHAGPDNAGRPLFMETDPSGAPVSEALKVIPIGLSQKDGEFIARYARKIQAICIAFGVPMTRLGDSSDRTFNNTGQEWITYYSKLKTICRELADAVNMNIAPMCGEELGWFDFGPLQESIRGNKFSSTPVLDAVKTLIVQINEARSELGLAPLPDGDRMLNPDELALINPAAARTYTADITGGDQVTNPLAVSANPEPSAKPEPLPSASAPGDDNTQSEDGAARFTPRATHQPDPTPPPPTPRPTNPFPPDRFTPEYYEAQAKERRSFEYRKKARTITTQEDIFERDFQRLLDRQRTTTLSRLTGKRGRQFLRGTATMTEEDTLTPNGNTATADEVFDAGYWRAETTRTLTDNYTHIFAGAANDVLDDLKSTTVFDVHNPLAQEFIKHRANQLASQVTDTTYQDITNALEEGVREGESIAKLADRITNLFEQTYASRATTVARTEVISAYNGATQTTGDALGADVVGGFEWLATQDARTRIEHALADGQVVTRGQHFNVGGSDMEYPGDPSAPAYLVVNCRCTILTLTPDEFDVARTAGNTPQTARSRHSHRGMEWRSLDEAQSLILAMAGVTPPEV